MTMTMTMMRTMLDELLVEWLATKFATVCGVGGVGCMQPEPYYGYAVAQSGSLISTPGEHKTN